MYDGCRSAALTNAALTNPRQSTDWRKTLIPPYACLRKACLGARRVVSRSILPAALCAGSIALAQSKSTPNVITLDWNKTIIVSKSTPTLQIVVNPMLRSGSPIHDAAYQAVKPLGADYVRY